MKTETYAAQRPIKRNTKQSGFPLMEVIEKGDKLLAVLDLAVPA